MQHKALAVAFGTALLIGAAAPGIIFAQTELLAAGGAVGSQLAEAAI